MTIQNKPWWRRRRIWVAAIYIVLLIASFIVRAFRPSEPPLEVDEHAITVRAVQGEQTTEQQVRLAYHEYGAPKAPALVLLHGSPGSGNVFRQAAPFLAQHYHVIAPDLPGFGSSTHSVPDYSIRAHAQYVLALLDALHIQRAHVVGFSMGGGVAINLADLAPGRVASLVMLSAIGVQEFELLGQYHLNHSVHGLQLAALLLVREGVPHFGALDDFPLDVAYGRNFFDTDQRPLRAILERYAGPMLIIQGSEDTQVPAEAAQEHHRIVPQSELLMLQDSHFMIFQKAGQTAKEIAAFLDRVERGQVATRATAKPDRVAQAAVSFTMEMLPMYSGIAAFVLVLLLMAATLVSEDLACIGAGVLVAQGRIELLTGIIACFVGIYVGDVLIFLAGRRYGRTALHRAPFKWFINAEDVERGGAWFTHKGVAVIIASRFLPGTRVATYFAAGMLSKSFWRFAVYFFVAIALWTPLLVGLAALLGAEALSMLLMRNLLLEILLVIGVVYVLSKLLVSLTTWRGRRMLLGAWRRTVRWEFWPRWQFYPPVIAYVLWLAWKYRSLTLFTAANPGIPNGGGLVDESKATILRGLGEAGGHMARWALIEATHDGIERVSQARAFMAQHGLRYPVVLKPDMGQRGAGVAVVRGDSELAAYLRGARGDTMIQEYVPGVEFGVFSVRMPGDTRGQIFAITDKRFPVVSGDGKSTLEHLILRDDRAVCMARFYLNKQADRLWDVPANGERVQLVELGTHSRGAIFLDGAWAKTEALEHEIDQISQRFAGFSFGRYDVRAPSVEAFKQGEFKVLELNGVTSEATNIYDPQHSLFDAYRVLFEQWRLAFAIGAANRARGTKPISLWLMLRLLFVYLVRRPEPQPQLPTRRQPVAAAIEEEPITT